MSVLYMRMCETMSKIVCKASPLRTDDYRLKGLTHSHRTCIRCEMFEIENINHMLMQCPAVEVQITEMYCSLYSLDARIEPLMQSNPSLVLDWLLGGAINELDEQVMTNFWITAGSAIYHMHNEVIAFNKQYGQ